MVNWHIASGRSLEWGAVTSFEVQPLSETAGIVGQNTIIRLAYDKSDDTAPKSIFAKFALPSEERRVHWQYKYINEVQFYKEFAHQVDVSTPQAYFSEFDEETGYALLLLEDCSYGELGDWIKGCSIERMRLIVTEIAKFHATWWEHPALPQYDWARMQDSEVNKLQQRYLQIADTLDDVPEIPRDPELLQTIKDHATHFSSWMNYQRQSSPYTLLHNDYHLNNLIFIEDNKLYCAIIYQKREGANLMTITQTLTRPASLREYQQRQREIQIPMIAESIRHGLAYQVQPRDLFITPYGKCGTTWLQQIVHSLRTRGDMEFDDISRVVPWLEMAHRLGLDLHAPQPGNFRAFKSHLSWTKIPKGGRYILPFRDPKDALVSSYNFLNGWHWQAGSISITEYARAHYLPHQDARWDGSYWGHLVSWWGQRHNIKVLLLTYEGMKANLSATVETIAHFLEIELDQPLRELVLKHSSLEFMSAHKSKFSDPLQQAATAKEGLWPPSETTSKVNKGQVGAHRTELPAEIGAEMDAIWREAVEPRTGLASYQDLRMALA